MSEPTDSDLAPETGSTNDDLHGAAEDVEQALHGDSDDDVAPTPGNG